MLLRLFQRAAGCYVAGDLHFQSLPCRKTSAPATLTTSFADSNRITATVPGRSPHTYRHTPRRASVQSIAFSLHLRQGAARAANPGRPLRLPRVSVSSAARCRAEPVISTRWLATVACTRLYSGRYRSCVQSTADAPLHSTDILSR